MQIKVDVENYVFEPKNKKDKIPCSKLVIEENGKRRYKDLKTNGGATNWELIFALVDSNALAEGSELRTQIEEHLTSTPNK